ncbi:MAG: glycerophosphodiester phosphodiesterase family protein [Pseudomonadota bacterium]|jgi:glycerophosphoryl diester phosphodiesterase|nr:glycerophosphodiester phosphodiesterase family protein [Pseudomonadota bacterium]
MSAWFDRMMLNASEALIACLPARRPVREQLDACRIVGHRGDRDARGVLENTLPAFDRLLDAGVWGLETDLRWSRDLQAVISHDANLARVFGHELTIAQHTLATLQAREPALPDLAQLVARYGGRLHLMLELKAEPGLDPAAQAGHLREALHGLQAGRDYHFIALDRACFDIVRDWPSQALAPIARLDVAGLSRETLRAGFGGLSAPAPLLRSAQVRRHRAAGQQVGVGFPRRRKSLLHEAARDVNWLFTDHACALQRHLDRAKADLKP